MKRFTVQLPDDQIRQLKQRALDQDTDVSTLIRRALDRDPDTRRLVPGEATELVAQALRENHGRRD